jgi:hypothetical protein
MRDSNSVKLSNIQFIPAMGNNTLLVKGVTSTSGESYLTQIQFKAVPYLDKADDDKGVSVLAVDSNRYYFTKLTKRDVVNVNCSCLDFYYRFARFTHEKNGLYGSEPKRFQKHTDRLPQNPKQVPALCKHLHKLFVHLQDIKIFS